jgi:hypothetical protein
VYAAFALYEKLNNNGLLLAPEESGPRVLPEISNTDIYEFCICFGDLRNRVANEVFSAEMLAAK